ncbi:MAG: exosome complex protein Rrp42 [Nanoarchaeota archaeon]|nr:exosome complex protein Rrp42 [Nanoarchaeota archaeon]
MVPKNYIQTLAKKNTRADGRKFDEFRKPITVEYSVSAKSAEGSARVTIGDTVVVAGVKTELATPYPDSPDEGSIMVNAELLPMSSPEFESGPPSIDSIELSRVVDRGIRESKALDFKKLCLRVGEKMWIIMIDIYPINASGNLFDAAALAAVAALKNAKFPKVGEKDVIDYKNLSDKSLPFTFMPVSCTVLKIGDKFLVDPIRDEELAADARLSVTFTEEGKICAMQKGGQKQLTHDEVLAMIDLAAVKAAELRKCL